MTVTTHEYGVQLYGAFCYVESDYYEASSVSRTDIDGGKTVSIPVILYKGLAVISPDQSHGDPILNITGDITTDGDGTYFVTGDCSIDVSD